MLDKGLGIVLAVLSVCLTVVCVTAQPTSASVRAAPPHAAVHIDPDVGHFMCPDGVTSKDAICIFRGVNVVYKMHPWLPRIEGPQDATSSLVDADMDLLEDLGVTVVRLGAMWPGVEIDSYKYNSSYLDALETVVNRLGQRGIYTLLDAHQDLLSRTTCGEGAYEAVVSPTPGVQGYPIPVTKAAFPVNQSTGLIDLETCLSMNFFNGYWSYAVSSMFQRFYDNVNAARDHFAQSWAQVAAKFANNPYVLGYEVINEPWPGDIYSDPKLQTESGYADIKNLMPLYEDVHKAIREKDQSHIMLYECAVHGSDFGAGFTSFPGGEAEKDRTAYSWHLYCSDSDNHLDPKSWIDCVVEWEHGLATRLDDWRRIDNAGAAIMTEFGANDNRTIGIDAMDYVLNRADDHIQGAIYWQFKYNDDLTTSGDVTESLFNADGTLQTEKVKALARTHAQKIAGVPHQHRFFPESGAFLLEYDADCDRAPGRTTVIYMSLAYWYPKGY